MMAAKRKAEAVGSEGIGQEGRGRDKRLQIYVDGACSGNPGPGGWGAVLDFKVAKRAICGGSADTTNNQMELTAAIKALARLKPGRRVVVFSDSLYVIKGMQEWVVAWQGRGWRAASGAPVKNVDLWRELSALADLHDIEWCWVKGHAGNPLNERADRLAAKGLQAYL